ncbi:MAG: YtxH domain-containing protein [Gemmatimonadetes bacterium]|nr:YtxH domain-containing protein [Gemmatimonadota bacterium]
MYYQDTSSRINFFAGLVVGLAVGAGIALLVAPQSGKRTRRQLLRAAADAREGAGQRWQGVAEELRSSVDAGRRRFGL